MAGERRVPCPHALPPEPTKPEIVTLMGKAFDLAWRDFGLARPGDQTFTKKLLASAIIASVEEGGREPIALAKAATKALRKVIETAPAAPDGER
jgi:hypothetical protein